MNEDRDKLLMDAFDLWLRHHPAWARLLPVSVLLWAAFKAGCEFVGRLEKGTK